MGMRRGVRSISSSTQRLSSSFSTRCASVTAFRAPVNLNLVPSLSLGGLRSFGNCTYVSSANTQKNTKMSESATNAAANTDERLLKGNVDKYDGVIIDAAALPASDADFADRLAQSLAHWTSEHKRGVWLKLSVERASLVPIAAAQGFNFHHAEKDYVMMTHWLPASENRLPPNASHQVGVGSIVIHEGKILLVQERNGPLKGTGVWKIPTGLVDAGEDIADAAVRELLEETGVLANFEKLLCFRQMHEAAFAKSDLFFVCVLRPTTFDIKVQEVELTGCDWHDPKVLFEQEFFQRSGLHTKIHSLIANEVAMHKGERERQPAFVHSKFTAGWRPGMQSLYYFDQAPASKTSDDDNNRS